MEIKKARRKTFEVSYVKVTAENMQEVAEWCGGSIVTPDEGGKYIHVTDKGVMNARQKKAFVGDLVLKNGNQFKSFTKSSFKKSFETTEI